MSIYNLTDIIQYVKYNQSETVVEQIYTVILTISKVLNIELYSIS